MSGLSTMGSISLGLALVAGRKRVPRPATGKTATSTRFFFTTGIGAPAQLMDGNHTTLSRAALPAEARGRESLRELTPLAAAGASTTPVSPWAAEPPRERRRALRPFQRRA